MGTCHNIIAGGLILIGLSGLLGCDRGNRDLEKRVEKAPYSSVESEKVGVDYKQFIVKKNIGHSKDGASQTASNLSLAGSLDRKSVV